MVIGIFGVSCTGKSSVAKEIEKRTNAKVFSGKDYLRGATNEEEAKKRFVDLLSSNEAENDFIVYVITEKEHLAFLPKNAIRIYMTADIETIKERFAKRMNGNLPPPVVEMIEKKHTLFDDEKYDMKIENVDLDISDIFDNILDICRLKRHLLDEFIVEKCY